MSELNGIPKNLLKDTKQTVQDLPEGDNQAIQLGFTSYTHRNPLLPVWGTRNREQALRRLWHNPHSTTFQSAVAGIAKRIQSTPWEVQADKLYGDYWQQLLMRADFGDWDRFIAKLITDYSRQDAGAYIEIIAPGSPEREPTGACTGIAVLDSMRCMPTGDPEYPVWYLSRLGKYHKLHASRVIRFMDMPDSTDDIYDQYGQCSLSRAVAPVNREILIAQYIQTKLDDKPLPGLLIFQNITEAQEKLAVGARDNQLETDGGSEWGRTIKLFGLNPEAPVSAQFITYSQPPEAFNFVEYTNLNVKQIAMAIGIDIQDIWELSGGGIGTGTQSAILAQKSRGKAIGRILKGLERIINRILPEGAEFVFKYEDPQEDMERAQVAQAVATTVITMGSDLTADERREIYANNIEWVADAILDEDGNITRLPDSDPKAPNQLIQDVPPLPPTAQPISDPNPDDTTMDDTKSMMMTRAEFRREFTEVVQFGLDGVVSWGGVRSALRALLQRQGGQAYLDGLADGGVRNATLDEDGQARVAEWRASQNQYIVNFTNELQSRGLSGTLSHRADLWVNMSLDPIYYRGLEDASPNKRYLWVVSVLKEHCVSCLRLNGQVHQLKSYRRIGLVPRSRALVCGGWECGCNLVETNLPVTGRLRSVRYVRGRREHEHHHHYELVA